MNQKQLFWLSNALIMGGLFIELGPINTKGLAALHVVLPVGAVLFGLYLVKRMLAKEEAAYALELQQHAPATAHRNTAKARH